MKAIPRHIDYKTQLLQTNLLPLTFKREVLDISFFLKSCHGKTGYDIRKYLRFTDEDVRRATRAAARGCDLCVINQHRNANKHFFPSRVARIWNALPDNIKL